MKLPNLRLAETQATLSMILGFIGLVSLPPLALFVFHGYNHADKVIHHDPASGRGRFRPPVIYATTAVSSLACATAGLLGFASLGHKRNTKQLRSWLGMTLGALSLATVLVLFFAWFRLNEPAIRTFG